MREALDRQEQLPIRLRAIDELTLRARTDATAQISLATLSQTDKAVSGAALRALDSLLELRPEGAVHIPGDAERRSD